MEKKLINMLLRARKKAQLSQVCLSRKLGKYDTFISKVEKGNKQLSAIEFLKLVKILNLDITRCLLWK